MNKTVKQLKKEIEKLFGLNYSLDEYALRVKTGTMNAGFLIQEADEDKTLFENHFKLQCVVIFGKEKRTGNLHRYRNRMQHYGADPGHRESSGSNEAAGEKKEGKETPADDG